MTALVLVVFAKAIAIVTVAVKQVYNAINEVDLKLFQTVLVKAEHMTILAVIFAIHHHQ